MEIRCIAPDELDALLALYQHLHPTDEALPPRSQVEAVWQSITGNPSYRYFGLYQDAALRASCCINLVANLTHGCRPYGLIENVVTHSEHRGCGYGQALLAHAKAFAWGQGCYKVMLMTGRKDEATFQFYESAGFNRHDKQAFTAKESKCQSI